MAMKFEKKSEGNFLLDVTGYVCPHPQIYTKKALEKVGTGDIVEIIFDNPSSSESIAAMCDSSGNEIVEKKKEGGKFMWKIKKVV
jgi:tRNA 2-thiouridine synthesizing protein A